MAKKKSIRKSARKRSVKKVGGKIPEVKPEKITVSPEPKKPEITPHPVAGDKVTDFENILDKQLSEDSSEKVKRPVGRPPKEITEEPERPELSIEVVAGVVKIPFELWSISQSVKSLSLTDEEANQIAEPAKQLLEHYLPQIPVIAYAWVSLSVSVFWVMKSRLLIIQEIKKQRERLKPPGPAEPAQPGVTVKFPAEIKPEKIE